MALRIVIVIRVSRIMRVPKVVRILNTPRVLRVMADGDTPGMVV